MLDWRTLSVNTVVSILTMCYYLKAFSTLDMAVPEVNMKLLEEMGFPLNLATRALHYCGWYICLRNCTNMHIYWNALVSLSLSC